MNGLVNSALPLRSIFEWRGKPHSLRCDNGPEYISQALIDWANDNRITLMYIQPDIISQIDDVDPVTDSQYGNCSAQNWYLGLPGLQAQQDVAWQQGSGNCCSV